MHYIVLRTRFRFRLYHCYFRSLITDIAGGAVWCDLHMICDILHHRTTARRCGAVLIRSGPGDGLHQVSRQTHLMELSDLER